MKAPSFISNRHRIMAKHTKNLWVSKLRDPNPIYNFFLGEMSVIAQNPILLVIQNIAFKSY
jgi:hypothetical protein